MDWLNLGMLVATVGGTAIAAIAAYAQFAGARVQLSVAVAANLPDETLREREPIIVYETSKAAMRARPSLCCFVLENRSRKPSEDITLHLCCLRRVRAIPASCLMTRTSKQ